MSDEEDVLGFPEGKPLVTTNDKKVAELFGIKSNNQTDASDTTLFKNPVIKEQLVCFNENVVEKTLDSNLNENDFFESSTNFSENTKLNDKINTDTKMKSILDFDDDDVFPNLPEKSKMPSNSQTKKSLMEDLFGDRLGSSSSIKVNKIKKPNNVDMSIPNSNSGESKSYTAIENDTVSKASTGFSLSAPKNLRRGRRATSIIQHDPLEMLTASSLHVDEPIKPEQKEIDSVTVQVTSKNAVTEDLPEWLGGPKVPKEQKLEMEKVGSNILSNVKSSNTIGKISNTTDPVLMASGTANIEQSDLTSKFLGIEFDQQATLINMQQQEYELKTAAVLSQQNEKLNHLLETQKIKLFEQEKKFNMLINKQLERQTLLEIQMKTQQDKINNYIQVLSAQPSAVSSTQLITNNHFKEASKELLCGNTELESQLQKLQLEKLYLENTLESLKEKHEKEISIIEDSYRKQIQYVEEAMVQMEKRMQDDIEYLETDYKLKIQKLKDEIDENQKLHKTEVAMIKEENEKLINEIRDRHYKTLDILQREHTEIIEKITKSKETEREAIEVIKSDTTNIQSTLNKSQVIIESLHNLEKKFEGRDSNIIDFHNNHLLIQEKNIEYLKDLLEKQKESFIEEKQKLMLTIQKLELDTSELIREFRKHNANFQQSEEILKSKEQALLRDREIFVEQTNWEHERLQALKESLVKEENKHLELLAEERQALADEKGKLKVFNKLNLGVDESSKIELEATIKAAQIATANANQEKLKFKEKLNELEIQRNLLQEKENCLTQKAKELQDFTQSALSKRDEGLSALKEARFIEERYKEKFNQMQIQQELLVQRETKLASEKLQLARDRLSYHVSQAEKPEQDTVDKENNKINIQDRSHISEVPSSSIQCPTYFKDIVDPHLILLKWNLDSTLEGSKEPLLSFSH